MHRNREHHDRLDLRGHASANALVPGAVVAGDRAIWELGQVKVYDGGADGLAATQPNTLFADQGVFAR